MDVCTGVGTGIGTTSIPVPDTSGSPVKYTPYRTHRQDRYINQVPHCDIKIRQILMISDSELQIFTFRSDEWIGLLTQSDIANPMG